MPITCRACDNPIAEERVNLDSGVACCQNCGTLWRCLPAPERAAGPQLPPANLPQGHSLTVEESRLTLEYPMRSKQTAPFGIFLLIFAAVWWGFVLHFSLGRSTEHGFFRLFSLLFSLPFWAAGIFELTLALFILFGRAKVTIEPTRAERRWSLGPFSYTRRAALNEGTTCQWHERPFISSGTAAARKGRKVALRPSMELRSRGGGSLGFGTMVAPEQRAAVAGCINDFLDRANSQPGTLIIPRREPPRRAACPYCLAELGPEALSVRDMRLDCPRCGKSAPLLFERAQKVAEVEEAEAEAEALRVVPRPEKTGIVIERPHPDQMAIFSPPHGFRGAPGFMLFFSLFWSAISLSVFVGFIVTMIAGKRIESGAWVALPVGILFTGIGAGMFYFAIKWARSKKLLSIERDRVVLRTTFMNRSKDVVAERMPGQFVSQVVAYEQNNRPVYKLSFQGTKLSFGTELDQQEKDWLEYEINRFLKEADTH